MGGGEREGGIEREGGGGGRGEGDCLVSISSDLNEYRPAQTRPQSACTYVIGSSGGYVVGGIGVIIAPLPPQEVDFPDVNINAHTKACVSLGSMLPCTPEGHNSTSWTFVLWTEVMRTVQAP